jgi:group II intron reverse transcriptase/maturase
VEGRGCRNTDPKEGTMAGTPSPVDITPKLRRIAELSRTMGAAPLTTLAHHIDLDFMHEAYRRTRKGGAVGIDGQTAEDFAADLEGNLQRLLDAFKSGQYRAPAVRRVYIPKADGRQRPLGIPTFGDKVLQQAVSMVLTAVYEPHFHAGSYGFRPRRSAHQALDALREGLREMWGGWVIDADIQGYFDTLDHARLRQVLEQRVRDGVIVRAVGKWLHAGVMEDGAFHATTAGTPQGGVVSPILANIYLDEVLDQWFEQDVRPRLRGRGLLVRYAVMRSVKVGCWGCGWSMEWSPGSVC